MPLVRFRYCVILSGLILLWAGGALAQDRGTQIKPTGAEPAPKSKGLPFTISPATTRITEPLTPDGMVDYVAALNARTSEGVTPENNAGVLLVEAVGTRDIPEDHREAFFQSLGIAKPTGDKEPLQRYFNLVVERLKLEDPESEAETEREPYEDQQTRSMEGPWSREEFPLVAKWLDANADALRITVEATKRPRLYFPIVISETDALVFSRGSISASDLRELSRLLTSRAMLAIHEQEIDVALEHQLANHRLAFLLGQQPKLMEVLISYVVNAYACETDRVLMHSPKISGRQLAEYRRQLEALPRLSRMSQVYDVAERYAALECICKLAANRLDPETFDLFPEKLCDRMYLKAVDWDAVLRRFNGEYDRMAAVLQWKHHVSRQAALQYQEGEIQTQLFTKSADAKRLVIAALILLGIEPPREAVNRHIGNHLLHKIGTAVDPASEAEARALTRRDLTILALALTEYHRDHGRFPDRLKGLVPQYVKTIPLDRFTDRSLKYLLPEDNAFLLYSVGPNGQDEEGIRDGTGADDIAVGVLIEPEA